MPMRQTHPLSSHPRSPARLLTISGLVMALYIVVMYLTQNFAFGQYQIRIATSLYALAAIHPFLILPLAAANLLSNALMGGFGLPDMIGGFVAGLLTAGGCFLLSRIHRSLVALPILLIPTLLVPLWLSALINVPYGLLVVSIGIGQIIPSLVGILLVRRLEKPLALKSGGESHA